MALAYKLVPGLESLPGIPGCSGKVRKTVPKEDQATLVFFHFNLTVFGSVIALILLENQQNQMILD
jgi:hypothetical protein